MDNSKGNTIINNKSSNINVEVDGKACIVLLQAVLFILKLCGVLQAPWWVVFLPTIIPLAGVVLMVVIILIAAIISPSFRHDVMKKTEDDKIDIEINGEEE